MVLNYICYGIVNVLYVSKIEIVNIDCCSFMSSLSCKIK